MTKLNSQLSLKMLQKVNKNRLSNNLTILWPDYQIIDLLNLKIQYWNIHHYISTSQMQCFYLEGDNIEKINDFKEYTHLAITSEKQNLIVFLSIRPIAIDKILYRGNRQLSICINVAILNCQIFMWGCLAIPNSINNQNEYSLVNPSKIVKNGQILELQIDQIYSSFSKFIFYGSYKQPRYGRKTYTNQIPQDCFKIFEMNTRFYQSYLDQALREQKPTQAHRYGMLPFHKTKLNTDKAINQNNNQNIMKNNIRRIFNKEPQIQKCKGQKNNINCQTNLQDYVIREQFNKLQNKVNNEQNIKQRWLKKYQSALVKQSSKSQLIKIYFQNLTIQVNKCKLKQFKLSNNNQTLFVVGKYHQDSIYLLRDLVQGLSIESISYIKYSQLIQILKISNSLQLEIIPQIILLYGSLNLHSNQWIHLLLLIVNQISIHQQVKNYSINSIVIYFNQNLQNILDNLNQLAYAYIIEIPSQILINIVQSSLQIVSPSNINHVTQLLSILIRIRFAFNIIELLSYFHLSQNIVLTNYQSFHKIDTITHSIPPLLRIQCYSSIHQSLSEQLPPIVQQFKFLINNPNQHLICLTPFKLGNNQFKTFVVISNNHTLTIFLKKLQSQSSQSWYYTCASVNIKIQTNIKTNNYHSQYKKFKYLWSNSSGYSAGISFNVPNCYQSQIRVTIRMKQSQIQSASAHYMALRIHEFLPVPPNVKWHRKSLKFSHQKTTLMLESIDSQCFSTLLYLPQIALFCLLQNDLIEVSSEISILYFLLQYYNHKIKIQNSHVNFTCFLVLRAQYIPIKYLIKASNNYPYLNSNQIFISILQKQLKNRLCYHINNQNNKAQLGSLQKPRISSYKLPQQDYLQQLAIWKQKNKLI